MNKAMNMAGYKAINRIRPYQKFGGWLDGSMGLCKSHFKDCF